MADSRRSHQPGVSANIFIKLHLMAPDTQFNHQRTHLHTADTIQMLAAQDAVFLLRFNMDSPLRERDRTPTSEAAEGRGSIPDGAPLLLPSCEGYRPLAVRRKRTVLGAQ